MLVARALKDSQLTDGESNVIYGTGHQLRAEKKTSTLSEARYGRSGRRVFEANQAPIINALHLFECLPVAETEKALVDQLKSWLQDSVEFDPEGWALPVLRKF